MTAPMVFSIRPPYVASILDGSKRWEFRTRMPSVSPGDVALIYESRGRKRIVGAFTVGSLIHKMTTEAMWLTIETIDPGSHGISYQDFAAYFDGRDAVAIGIVDPVRIDLELPQRPPQSWARYKGDWPLGIERGDSRSGEHEGQ